MVPRLLAPAVQRALAVMPAVVVTGARQTGKTTLVRELLDEARTFFTLDDLEVRLQAERVPDDLVTRAPRMTLDEVQRTPELLIAVKRAIDNDRRAGRFLLTGSANLLLMRDVSESLAGRASHLVLRPLTLGEQRGHGRAGRWPELFEHDFAEWTELLAGAASEPVDWRDAVRRGGYPTPSLDLATAEERAIWYGGFVQTYLERDLQDLSSIDNLADFRRLMGAVAQRLGQLANQTELGRGLQLPQPTVRRWLNLLETSWQLVRLPAYAVNRVKRLIKTPRLYWSDPGLALHLAGDPEPRGADLENLILSDVLAWRDAEPAHRPEVCYWRTTTGEEVDLVIEWRGAVIAIEIKAAARVDWRDARHLLSFRDEYGDRVAGALLLHTGTETKVLAERVLAVPWWRVL